MLSNVMDYCFSKEDVGRAKAWNKSLNDQRASGNGAKSIVHPLYPIRLRKMPSEPLSGKPISVIFYRFEQSLSKSFFAKEHDNILAPEATKELQQG
jgi:hypothetical protein